MKGFPNTEDRDNWSVFLFDCRKDKAETLIVSLFEDVRKIVPNGLPYYSLRSFPDEPEIKISFRVLRDKTKTKTIRELEGSIRKLLENENATNIVINPENVSQWGGSSDTFARCEAYSKLTEFVVRLAQNKMFSVDERNYMRHLAINMLFMREGAVLPEQYSYFVDYVSGQILSQPNPAAIQRFKPGEMKHE